MLQSKIFNQIPSSFSIYFKSKNKQHDQSKINKKFKTNKKNVKTPQKGKFALQN